MLDFNLISADTHVAEPPAAWERAQREYPDRAPRVVENPDGIGKGLWIITDGMPPMRSAYFALGHLLEKPQGHVQIDESYGDPQDFRRKVTEFNDNFRYQDWPGGWDPAAHVKDMDRDGVEAEIVISSPTRFNYSQTDARFQRSIFRSYNEWVLEFASYAPKRLFPMPLISILDVELAVKDMQEYVMRGCKSVHLPTVLMGSGYYEPEYEPLWSAAEDLGIPITVHQNSNQGLKRHHVDQGAREYDPRKYIINVTRASTPVECISNLIFSGVFDRHPKLKLVCSEFECWWVPGMLERVDYSYYRESTYDPEKNLNKRPPSEYIKERVFFGFEDSRSGILQTPMFGANNYLWGNDYPHHTTTWPYSRKILEDNCKGFDASLPRKLGRDNVNQLYKLGLN
jgi:uncharacterized protein